MRGRAVVAYQAHNLKVCGSIPHPATKKFHARLKSQAFFLEKGRISWRYWEYLYLLL